MCHYITAVLPASAKHLELAEIAARHGRKLEPLANPSVEEQLYPGERYFLTTRGHCDCGTALGALLRETLSGKQNSIDAEVAKLHRKGWSQTKIARWKEQQKKNQSRPVEKARLTEGNIDWLRFLSDVLASKYTPSFGLLLHWYDGPLTSRLPLKKRLTVSIEKIGLIGLGNLEEDVLYDFVA